MSTGRMITEHNKVEHFSKAKYFFLLPKHTSILSITHRQKRGFKIKVFTQIAFVRWPPLSNFQRIKSIFSTDQSDEKILIAPKT